MDVRLDETRHDEPLVEIDFLGGGRQTRSDLADATPMDADIDE